MTSSVSTQGPQATRARDRAESGTFAGFTIQPGRTNNPEMAGGRSSRLVSPGSQSNPLAAATQTEHATLQPKLRADTEAALAGIFRFMSTIDSASNRQQKLAAISSRLRNVLAGQDYGHYKDFKHFSPAREAQFLQGLGLGEQALTGPLPGPDKAALITAMGSVTGRLGKEVLPNMLSILFSGGSSANRTTALSSVAYWSAVGAFTGKTSSDYAAANGGQARKDLAFAQGLMRDYSLTEIRAPKLAIKDQPSITLLHAIASALAPEIMFGGERKYGGRVNGPLMQAGAKDTLVQLDAANIVSVLEARARQEMARGDEFAWATRSLIMLSRGRTFLMADGRRWSQYSPDARAKIDRIGRSAEAILPSLQSLNSTAYVRTWGMVDKTVKLLEEATGEFSD